MNTSITRRHFLKTSALVGASFASLSKVPSLRADSANNKIRVAVMGTNGRGMNHISAFTALPEVEIAYICDVDTRALAKGIKAVAAKQGKAPQGVKDIRTVLDDKSIDAISIATPNHWHAPATILACAAGKHVYVEKPGSHNPHEAEMMVAAARKHNRVVQMGTQRRSWPWVIEAIERLHGGVIGRTTFARCWYNNSRLSIGTGKAIPAPDTLDYSLWQGPAPERHYTDNLIPYNWHWRWHWGNGELGNNGIHPLDVARWGLSVEYPKRITCSGGRYHFQDDQETPDTYITTFDFGDKGVTFDGHSCDPHGFEGMNFGILFYGEKGSLVIGSSGYKILDLKNKQLEEKTGKGGDLNHFANFVDCIRSGKRPHADIEEGQKSTLLCHLGNIAWRSGQTINFDPATRKIVGGGQASALWQRDYRPGWEPKV
jgi:predicted dehydrogenase